MRMRTVLSGRGFMLLPAAAFAVHQLRYELGYGTGSSAALSAQGHGYQNSLAPWVALLLAVALGAFVVRFADAASGRAGPERRRSFGAVFALAWALLVAVYCLQEWLESVFAVGHPGGLAGIVGHGGWWAIVVAAPAALAVAALLRAASTVLAVAARIARRRGAPPARLRAPRPAAAATALPSPLARRSAGRAPPALPAR